MTFQEDILQASLFLKRILEEQGNDDELSWVNQQEEKLRNNYQLRSFYLAFTSASRFIRKDSLQLTQERLAEADKVRRGFQPEYWNLLQCARVYLLLILPAKDETSYEVALTKLYETADVEEQVTLYSALPLLPYPDILVKQAADGIRTNITDVFDAIALNNPYPGEFLDDSAWNQMVLKAVFMQRPLYRIYKADHRANPDLTRMLVDFAHERWAAGRNVSPELWRFVGPFLNEDYLADIEKVIKTGGSLEKQAGLLACADSELPQAQELLEQYPELQKEIENGRLNWSMIGKKNEDDFQN